MDAMRSVLAILGLAAGLTACGYTSEYEAQVHDWEPVYCYKTLAAVECQREPDRTRDARLVNYYGPDPIRADKPEPQEEVRSAPPPPVNYWVKDPEPIPRPAPQGDLSDRPWLVKGADTAAPPAVPAPAPAAAPVEPDEKQSRDATPEPPVRSL